MRLARWTANHPRSRVFHFKLVHFNDSKKIPQAKTQSKSNWTKQPLLYNETMADSTTLQMPCVLNRNKKGKLIPSPSNRRSLQYAGIPFSWYLQDRLERKNFQWRITKHSALWVKWIRFDSILETTKGLQPIAAQMVIHTWDSVDGVIHI